MEHREHVAGASYFLSGVMGGSGNGTSSVHVFVHAYFSHAYICILHACAPPHDKSRVWPVQIGGGLAGIAVESQDYRALIEAAIMNADPTATIVDPIAYVGARAGALHPPGTRPEVSLIEM
jgi:hypothetical protein